MSSARELMVKSFPGPAPGRSVGQAIREAFYASKLYQWSLNGRAPLHVRGTPPDPWPGDPDLGRAICAGRIPYYGRSLPLTPDPWHSDWQSVQAREWLHGFVWLRHLRAQADVEAIVTARELVEGWLNGFGDFDAFSWRPDVLGQRLAAWFASLEFMAPDKGDSLRHRILESAARQERHLVRALNSAPRDGRRFQALRGLIACGVCLPGQEDRLELGLKSLQAEIERQVLPDGSHIERNPEALLTVLRHLIDIRKILMLAQVEVPEIVQCAIDRMAPMVRGLRHGDGRLALFNGGKESDAALIDTALTQSEAKGKPTQSAPHGGFQRIAAGRSVIILDTGGMPPDGADRMSHAGTLSFEFSVGKERLVVNCGAHSDDPNWHAATRSTAAHSTVVIEDTNTVGFRRSGGAEPGLEHLSSQRREQDGNVLLEVAHDGYEKPFGVLHRRALFLAADGEDFRGEDLLSGEAGRHFQARFHLHPDVHATLVEDGETVLLRTKSGKGWRFKARGGNVDLEESIYLGASDVHRRSLQIVVSGTTRRPAEPIKWAFSRIRS